MLYDYECQNCKYFMEDVYQSIKDEALTECPECKENTLERVITGGLYGHVYQEPTTIGQAADKNWRKKGHYERSNALQADSDKSKERQAKRDSIRAINKLNPSYQHHYIMTGEMRK